MATVEQEVPPLKNALRAKLREGTQSPEHAAFAQRLDQQRVPK